VIAAVHHAEVVAHRVGEPFGTLVLAVAVTVIEVSLILSIMLAGGPDAAALPRDTIYAAVMIICNGVVGLCVLVGGLVHREQSFRVEGSSAALAALIALSTFSLVLPVFTTTTPSGTYSNAQLAFAAITSLALWAVYVFIQTVRHRDYFLPPADASSPDAHAKPPTNREAWASFGLTIPVVAVAAIALGMPLILGLGPKELVMRAVTFLLSAVTLGTGRTHMMAPCTLSSSSRFSFSRSCPRRVSWTSVRYLGIGNTRLHPPRLARVAKEGGRVVESRIPHKVNHSSVTLYPSLSSEFLPA
jgi:Ca2+:H+ antiporter